MSKFSACDLAAWCGGKWRGSPPGNIESISNDTRTLGAGALYVALHGDNFDGHDFLDAAFANGAVGAVVNSQNAAVGKCEEAILEVDDTGRALLEMGHGYGQSVHPRIIGITGSVGKSSVKEMLAQIIARQFVTASTKGNWNNQVGLPLSMLAMPLTTQVAVLELGMSHPGDVAELTPIANPSIGVVTNVGPVHIEFFENEEAIAEEKANLLRALPRDGLAVINLDGGHADILRGAAAPVATVSMQADADYVCSQYNADTHRAVIREKESAEEVTVQFALPGEFIVTNAMQAVAVARHLGIAWDDIRTGLENYEPLPLRWEVTKCGQITCINDAYNANPVSMHAALRTFERDGNYASKWLVLGDMLELGERAKAEHRRLGELVASGAWQGVLAVGKFAPVLAEGAVAAGMQSGQIRICRDAAEAAQTLISELKQGDAVFLKASRSLKLETVVVKLAEKMGAEDE